MNNPRFNAESGVQAFTGNELILKGGLEAEMALLTGYPGSPVSDIFDAVYENRDLLEKNGVLGQMANNEALAAARLNGARMASLRALAVMKSVGMHVAADGLAIGNLSEPNHPEGGALVVVGDDAWNETTQINSDSRYLAQHLQMPILEPATFQELKDWIGIGFELSGASNLYAAYIITTNQADGGAGVRVRKNRYPPVNLHRPAVLSASDIPVRDFVMIPPHTSQKEATLRARFERFLEGVRAKKLNQILYADSPKPSSVGFVTSGITHCYLEHAFFEMGIPGRFPILKMGVPYPVDPLILGEFLNRVETVIVVEEKRAFLEDQIRSMVHSWHQEGGRRAPAIFGKAFPFDLPGIPETRGLNPSVLIERLGELILKGGWVLEKEAQERLAREIALVRQTGAQSLKLPLRTPTFCPGCPHRDSATVSLKLKKEFLDPAAMEKQGRPPMELIFHGESGCHSMLQFAPNLGLMQNYSGMGLGGGTGAGIDPFIRNKQVVFLGDSTFFHSGMIAVSDSIKNGQDITYVILDNKTTAMTGHQPNPGNDFDVMGRATFAQDVERAIRGLAEGSSIPIYKINPADRERYETLLRRTVSEKGVKVVIADKECAITYQRRLRREKKRTIKEKGFLPREEFINIVPEVCEFCLECTRATGCPGLTIEETSFGPKIATDLSTCVADGACAKGKVCPSFEVVTVHRKNPPRPRALPISEAPLPLPEPPAFEDTFYIASLAVGGMGAGVVSATLVQAGLLEGYHVSFLDKKGLAIRNGSVYGHIVFSHRPESAISPLVPYGKADLILGIDLLEAARGADPQVNMRVAGRERSHLVLNTHKTETVLSLMGEDSFQAKELEPLLRSAVRPDGFLPLDFSEVSQRFLGSKIYVNLMMLGAAFQKGWIPVSFENLERAVRLSVPAQELEENLKALRLGRQMAGEPELFSSEPRERRMGAMEIVAQKELYLAGRLWSGRRIARQYRNMAQEAMRWMHLDEEANRQIALRVYELIQYEDPAYARRYLSLLWDIYRKDRSDANYAATRAAIDNLFRVMAIKDEVYVAHLLTAPEKYERDRQRYRIDPLNGDRADVVHLNRPQFVVAGIPIEFDLRARDWMLRAMKRAKFLRRWLPQWHRREKDFLAWYEGIARDFNYFEDDRMYWAYVELLRLPESVRGYRQVRYGKMEEALEKSRAIAARLETLRRRRPRPASGAEIPG